MVIRRALTSMWLAFLIAGCQAPGPGAGAGSATGAENAAEEGFSVVMLSAPEVISGPESGSMDRRQFIADILFEALQALDADRLLTPVDDNAHARFQRVLAYEPDNALALQGLQDIAARYLELALQASRRGLFAEAATMLENARFVAPDHPDIADAVQVLQAEMNSDDLFFELDARELSQRSDSAQQRLAEIARQAREHSANFLITAPNDELARWMYNAMRDAVDGYRLRGNIELASRTTVRLRMPRN